MPSRSSVVRVIGVSLVVVRSAMSQVPVPVGAGSYASSVPVSEGTQIVAWAESPPVYVVDPATRPIPTTKWWTDLIMRRYSGNLWAYPFTVSADASGVNIYRPTTWNAGGTEMDVGPAVRVRGRVAPSPSPDDRLLADFEGASFPAGWVTTGSAFGPGPASGTWPGQSQVGNYLGSKLANSFYGSDAATGTLTSAPFLIDRDYLHFLIGGGNRPGTACVNFVVNTGVVISASASNSESMTWVSWNVAAWNGQTGSIQVIDKAQGGWGHILADHFVLSDNPSNPSAFYSTSFAPVDARALRWGDWTLSFRMAQRTNAYLDATIGRGQPFAWFEATGLSPEIVFASDAQVFGSGGAPVALPLATQAVGVAWRDRLYGVYVPGGAVFSYTNGTISVAASNVVVGALSATGDLDRLAPFAGAIPRDSRYDWEYDPASGDVDTIWSLDTVPLSPGATNSLLGWLPHHLRGTRHELALSDVTFATPRGPMRLSTGRTARITYSFPGLLPTLPAPQPMGWSNDFSIARMSNYLQGVANDATYDNDTYWGGKDVLRYAQNMWWARSLGAPVYTTLLARSRTSLADWYTYTPGEAAHYFVAYTNWGALVGFNTSYGSEYFVDHHFHHGYFTYATALLGLVDPAFLADYGAMATLVAREYANWDRSNTNFPYLRSFDPWAGHSYAGGQSSINGNNQESSSEAIQSWGGLFLLGEALGDEGMRAAGAMGWSVESAATRRYWFNSDGDLFPPGYTKSTVGILFNWGQAYATYFDADPGWIHAIQWLPPSPLQAHLARDPAFSASRYNSMLAERLAAVSNDTISSMGASLGNFVLGYRLQFDPEAVVTEFEALWQTNDVVTRDTGNSGATYYQAHANRRLGQRRWDLHVNSPLGAVYESADGTLRAVAHVKQAQVLTVSSNGVPVAHVVIPTAGLFDGVVEPGRADVIGTAIGGEGIAVCVNAVSGLVYRVWGADRPGGDWQPSGPATSSTGGVLWLNAGSATGIPGRVYQVRQTPP